MINLINESSILFKYVSNVLYIVSWLIRTLYVINNTMISDIKGPIDVIIKIKIVCNDVFFSDFSGVSFVRLLVFPAFQV